MAKEILEGLEEKKSVKEEKVYNVQLYRAFIWALPDTMYWDEDEKQPLLLTQENPIAVVKAKYLTPEGKEQLELGLKRKDLIDPAELKPEDDRVVLKKWATVSRGEAKGIISTIMREGRIDFLAQLCRSEIERPIPRRPLLPYLFSALTSMVSKLKTEQRPKYRELLFDLRVKETPSAKFILPKPGR